MNSILLVLFLSFYFSGSLSWTTSVYPVADSFLDSGNPNSNYGTLSTAYVYRDVYGNLAYFDLVTMFNISQLPSSINSAKVSYKQQFLSADEILGPYNLHDVYEISTNWTETGVTWNNPPISLRRTHQNYQDYDILAVEWPATTVYNDAKLASRDTIAFRIQSSYPAGKVRFLSPDFSSQFQ